MKEIWNERYRSKQYVYGKEPNDFFKLALQKYDITGKLLLPAEGEGRNAVYAAKKGLTVYAFDISEEGRKKALRLAKEKNTEINYQVGTLQELNFPKSGFDAAALIYAHFPPDILSENHKTISGLIRPGGYIILEGFSKNHLPLREKNPEAGGPKNIDMLFSEKSIRNDFSDLEILELNEVEKELREGHYHNGIAKVIRYVGRKKA